MLRLAEDDPRFIEWRVKLGILLKQELSPNPQDGLPWYVQFPRGYWLYERSKHLWVSGYPVKSKLFKSPQEFGVHLLWLISGSNDPRDCCCVHCNLPKSGASGEELIVQDGPRLAAPAAPVSASAPAAPASSAPAPAPAAPPAAPPARPLTATTVTAPVAGASPATPTPPANIFKAPAPPSKNANATAQSAKPSPVSTPAPSASAMPPTAPYPRKAEPPVQASTASPAPRPMIPEPPPRPTPLEQTLVPFNQSTSPLFFRTGELVWFSVAPSWRIGLIARSNLAAKQYEILPISHGLFNQSQLQLKPETALRPFLAFTVPPVSLPDLSDKSFDKIPWDTLIGAVAAEPTKREPLLLDASKLAAIKISMSFSLFTRIGDSEGGRKTNYHGIFLGAERIEVGDALRVRVPHEQQNLMPRWALSQAQASGAFLGLREICTARDTPGYVFFKGDLYIPITGEHNPGGVENDPNSGGDPVIAPDEKLPRALREEAAFRTKFAPRERWRLALLRQNTVLREQDIQGRFYPSARLLPVLVHPNANQLQAELQKGVVRDSARQLNQRFDTFKDGYIGQKAGRVDAVGAAIPHGSAALFGFEPVVREEAPPLPPSAGAEPAGMITG
ncbi:hypothetical protein SODALDRAFT_276432 [Sodiomyces alkalinus F11]|uniref:Cryptic loci regulator 2 N-terminal domain-containing protein n=1 Tax=Sodiomyces alkalinus (strain CBS 110278 / VKM F-3762 / F11) TaxID=1314773 RepID=A0A3N2PY48_SODAK|nr:hypothetical protein SODALDRAFT_276432 [Sodiomyces alkalinus F11]ROT39453.1 hypothetical protein SODALDRAFT_276432 [Sodiomyces alkalinus F11]